MSNMGYCRHENTARDLADVWEQWYDTDFDSLDRYERVGRKKIVQLVAEMYDALLEDGTFEELGVSVYYAEEGDQ